MCRRGAGFLKTRQVKQMQTTQRHPRFEVSIKADERNLKHACAAPDKDAAVERVLRSYQNNDPILLNVKPLGVMRASLRRLGRAE